MKRAAILTVGKTHSGKTTFAKALEKRLANSVVIDQDNHGEFLHTNYAKLLPAEGPNTIKYALTKTIVDYAINETACHLILCNSNRNQQDRLTLLRYLRDCGFETILVYFDIPDTILAERVASSQRTTAILRTASSFGEVLNRQRKEAAACPTADEADHFLRICGEQEMENIIEEILNIATN
ncbi:AAA family ATPase [Indiicoccus explosivorum]|uniref:AAA family ATPase n=1 Tax=Indiicoccus explosivorum TaxID=1917864 RepID=UPI000B438095|nr:ATP-binding protein [Indiicoccus explosivorum]